MGISVNLKSIFSHNASTYLVSMLDSWLQAWSVKFNDKTDKRPSNEMSFQFFNGLFGVFQVG